MRKYMCYAMVKMLMMIGGFICLFSMNAFGTDIYIPDAYLTIQQGIDAAIAGDTIIVRDGTYLLTAALDFKGKAITVISENGKSNCILDGQNLTRIAYFHTAETSASILSGFTIQNGLADKGGAIYCEESSPIITQCTIRQNNASADIAQGGAIYLKSSSASITYCQISDNKASGVLQDLLTVAGYIVLPPLPTYQIVRSAVILQVVLTHMAAGPILMGDFLRSAKSSSLAIPASGSLGQWRRNRLHTYPRHLFPIPSSEITTPRG